MANLAKHAKKTDWNTILTNIIFYGLIVAIVLVIIFYIWLIA